MSEEKRMLGNYEVTQSIYVGDKEVVLAVDKKEQYPFLVCYCDYHNPLSAAWATEGVASDDYLEAMEIFTERVQSQIDRTRAELSKFPFDKAVFTKEHCIPDDHKSNMVGWISIAGTTVNYPVMQTPNDPNFYLKHNFEKAYSDLGVPYIQEDCDLAASDNLIIYGHHIKGQKMFGALESYKDKDFYEEHKSIQFDTLTEQAEYEIVAVFKTVAYSSEGFRYYDFVDAEDEKAFDEYVSKCKEFALYDTGVTAKYGDKLITLSTCEYSAQNGRLVVVAKKIA